MKEEKIRQFVEKISKEMPEAIKGMIPKVTRGLLDFELGPAHIFTLEMISKRKSSPKISEIAKSLPVSFAMMTRIIDRLESKGLVSRSSDPSDRRAIRVKLTLKGKAVSRKIRGFRKQHMMNMLNGFEEKDREVFMEAITVITDIMVKYGR